MASENVVNLTEENFENEVIKSSIPVMVDFWADWCGPCKAIAPLIDQIADEKKGQYKIGKVNVTDQESLAMKYGIRNIPALLFFKNGQLRDQVIGGVSKKDLEAKLSTLV
ncbi:MAG: thioredoxin [Verrucomicrobiota bacterium]|nr:thioredoxin [Verrucomicrobiota bacterium]